MMALLPSQEESIWFILIGQISKMKTMLEFLEVFLSKWCIPSYFQICKELRASETWGECSAHISWYPLILSEHLNTSDNTKCSQFIQVLIHSFTYSNRKQCKAAAYHSTSSIHPKYSLPSNIKLHSLYTGRVTFRKTELDNCFHSDRSCVLNLERSGLQCTYKRGLKSTVIANE